MFHGVRAAGASRVPRANTASIQALAGRAPGKIAQGLPGPAAQFAAAAAAGCPRGADSITLGLQNHANERISIMATDPGARMADAAMDETSLYREEIYTDRKIGTLRVLSPVKADGTPDTLRRTVYQGEAQLMTNVGPLPISFDIDASSLGDAVAKYAESTKAGIERAMRELQEMRRQQSSSIVLPPAGATLAAPGGLPGGGGKIQLP
jgi:hypothetical protein